MERMFPPPSSKKVSSGSSSMHHDMCDSGLVLTTDPKPRLRWTVELHERFVDAVAQLGGPDSKYNTTILQYSFPPSLSLSHHPALFIILFFHLVQTIYINHIYNNKIKVGVKL